MDLTQIILYLIDRSQEKKLVEIGAHDDNRTLELALHFRHVCSYYEYLKIPERTEGNIEIRRLPYLQVLDQLDRFDVILLENEFHHFPDIWQMWTYDRLQPHQELLLVEWDFTGNNDAYYSVFQNCRPLCGLTREILSRFAAEGMIRVEEVVKGKTEAEVTSRDAMIDRYRFILPDHWRYGEKHFLAHIADIRYPITIWEGFDVFKIRRC